MNKYMYSQKKRIELEKWYEGQRLNRDPGVDFVLNWIRINAGMFRTFWNNSLCKNCVFCEDCGHLVKTECNKYKTRISKSNL